MADDDAPKSVATTSRESKPKDVSTAILERKKAPNRLVVGASFVRFDDVAIDAGDD